MKRLLMLGAACVAVVGMNRSASAQFGFGAQTPMGETIQKERQDLLNQQQAHAHSAARPATPAPRYQPSGRTDAYGRMDLSGRAAPGYPTIRDGSFKFSQSHYVYTPARRRTTSRHATAGRSRLRIPPPPPIR